MIFIKKAKYSDKGFTLMEVMITLFLLFVGISGSFLVIQRLLTMSEINNSRLIAANLAQEGVEVVKNIRDSNWLEQRTTPTPWDDGLNNGDYEVEYNSSGLAVDGSRKLRVDTTNGFYNYTTGTETKFKRMITISHPAACSPDCVKAIVTVYWQDRWGDFEFIIEEDIYNWDY